MNTTRLIYKRFLYSYAPVWALKQNSKQKDELENLISVPKISCLHEFSPTFCDVTNATNLFLMINWVTCFSKMLQGDNNISKCVGHTACNCVENCRHNHLQRWQGWEMLLLTFHLHRLLPVRFNLIYMSK